MTESIKHGEMIRKDNSLNKLKKKETLRRQACCLILMISVLISAAAGGEQDPLPKSLAAGDYVVFGRYEQDGDPDNGPEPVEWLVLETSESDVLLVSRYCLDTQPFHGENVPIQWDQCDLRQWMNTDMLKAMFTEEELAQIGETALEARKHPHFTTSPGQDTVDRLFLLSYEEVERFFPDPEDRLGFATPYARSQRAWVNRENGASGWWLRTTGHSADDECRVSSEGKFVNYDVNYKVDTVRPAMRLKVSGEKQE